MMPEYLVTFFLATAIYFANGENKLGKGFYLPGRSLYGDFDDGADLFSSLPTKTCVTSAENNKLSKVIEKFTNSQKFFYRLASEFLINPERKLTMADTLKNVTDNIAETSDIIGSSIQIHAYSKEEHLNQDCQNTVELDSAFKASFEALPTEVENPSEKKSWAAYEKYLKTFGTHFLTVVRYGSSVIQWNFADIKKKYTMNDLEARSCGDLLGNSEYQNVGIQECSRLTPDQISNAPKVDVTSKLIIKGGTRDTEAALRDSPSATSLNAFLQASTKGGAVGHAFSEIWDILRTRYITTEHASKCLNLEFYYKGFLENSCDLQKDAATGEILREFVRADHYTKERPVYKCQIPNQGCKQDSDCHNGGWLNSFRCFCHGNSCFEHKQSYKDGKVDKVATVRTGREGGTYDGVNKSCGYKVGGCMCNKTWGPGMLSIWKS